MHTSTSPHTGPDTVYLSRRTLSGRAGGQRSRRAWSALSRSPQPGAAEPRGVGKPQLACVVLKKLLQALLACFVFFLTELTPNPWPWSFGMDTSLQHSGSPRLPGRLEFKIMSKSARTGDVQSDAHIMSNVVVEASDGAGAMSRLMASSVGGDEDTCGLSIGLKAPFEESFDLAPPAPRFTATDVEWVAHAKELASRVRFGHWTHIVWWGVGRASAHSGCRGRFGAWQLTLAYTPSRSRCPSANVCFPIWMTPTTTVQTAI